MRIGIYGYGNLARGVELAIRQNPDMELVAVFTRRDPATVTLATPGIPVYRTDEVLNFRDAIDVMILCGGKGTRLRDVTELLPKPMVPIGEQPILWHIMKSYAHYGFNEFIICAGYRQHVIKEWFAD